MTTLTPEARDALRALAAEYDDDGFSPLPSKAGDAIHTLLDALGQAEAERDQARAQVDRVRAALSNHPRACEKYPDGYLIGCGWKSAVLDVQTALDGEQ